MQTDGIKQSIKSDGPQRDDVTAKKEINCPHLRDQFSDSSVVQEPYDYYAQLRSEAPVFYSTSLQSFVVTSYADIQTVSRNPDIFSSDPSVGSACPALYDTKYNYLYEEAGTPPLIPGVVNSDGATHSRFRSAVDQAFKAGSVKKLEGSIRTITDGLINKFIERGKCDLKSEFCLWLPLYMICDLIGLKWDKAPLFQSEADATVHLFTSYMETEASIVAFTKQRILFQQYIQKQIDKYRHAPAENLLSYLLHTKTIDGDFLTDQEIHSLLMSLNSGGNETTTNGLAVMFHAIYSDVGNADRLRANPGEIPKFIEEVLRLDSPVTAMPRWARADTQLAGVQIPAGSAVHLCFAAANRDEAQFPGPDAIDIGRAGLRNHMVFGMGIHYCLGQALARLELRIAAERMLERIVDGRFVDDVPKIGGGGHANVRGPASLPITFTPGKQVSIEVARPL